MQSTGTWRGLVLVLALAIYSLDAASVKARPAKPQVPVFAFKWGHSGTADGEFQNPWDIVVTPNNTVLVTEELNNRVQEFDSLGHFLNKFGEGQLFFPEGLAVDRAGRVYVADTGKNRVRKFD